MESLPRSTSPRETKKFPQIDDRGSSLQAVCFDEVTRYIYRLDLPKQCDWDSGMFHANKIHRFRLRGQLELI